ncbi:DUF4760 domain-containing protein [Pseudomonas moraviensis]|uniref:DUF4760 domain-containing protein n=1 Tax=Pseudomonas moraviensis TaxID=321662 RepID=UPI00105A5678|nr:hypothetical protein [Pseudomonas moraviensis]TDK53836.1 hypothetical protein E1508_16535 [Pseudomonas moraviensis]
MEIYLIEAIGLMFSAMAALGTLMIAVLLMRLWRSYETENKTQRVERTLSALQIPEDITNIVSEVVWRDLHNEPVSARDFNYGKVFRALDYFENLAIGIRTGVYDERLAYERIGQSLPSFYFAVVRYVYESRSEGTAPGFYIQVDRLARDWQRNSPEYMEEN